MAKIPVRATIAGAYRFAFMDFPKILGVIWLPWAVTAVCSFILLRPLADILVAIGKQNFAGALKNVWILLPFFLLNAVLYVTQIAATLELALQQPRRQERYRFSIGRPVWRLMGAFILIVLVYVAAWIVSLLAGILIGLVLAVLVTVAKTYMTTILTIGFWAIAALVYAGFLYVTVRLAFLLSPTVVAEEKISFRRVVTLGAGNFWRLLLIFLATFLPYWIIQRVLLVAIAPDRLFAAVPRDASPEVKAAALANVMNWAAHFLELVREYWYLAYPIGLIWAVLHFGLIFGAQAIAYRAVATDLFPVTDR